MSLLARPRSYKARRRSTLLALIGYNEAPVPAASVAPVLVVAPVAIAADARALARAIARAPVRPPSPVTARAHAIARAAARAPVPAAAIAPVLVAAVLDVFGHVLLKVSVRNATRGTLCVSTGHGYVARSACLPDMDTGKNIVHEVLDPLLAVLEGDGRVIRGAQEAHGAGGVEKGHDREALGVERSH